MTWIKQIGQWLGIAAAATGVTVGVYQYVDTQDISEDLPINELRVAPEVDISEIYTIFMHHDAGPIGGLSFEQMAMIHVDEKGWPTISYGWGIKDGIRFLLKYEDKKGNQAKLNNTHTMGIVLSGNYEVEQPSVRDIQQVKILLFSLLTTHPNITQVLPHNQNEHSATKCPGKFYEEMLIREGLIFHSRDEIRVFLKCMEMKMLNIPFEDDEGC